MKKNVFLNLFIVILLLLLPYYLFNNKLYIGGDDTRLYYVYSSLWIKNVAFYSWFHLSSQGNNNPNQFIIPFLLLIKFLNIFLTSKKVVEYLFFSLTMIGGFLFFQLLLSEIKLVKNKFTMIVSALFYVLSPILVFNQLSNFLYSVWLIPAIPLLMYIFIKYINTKKLYILFIAIFTTIFLIPAFASIPWLIGFMFPLLMSLSIFAILNYKMLIKNKEKIKLLFIFLFFWSFIQTYWVFPFAINFIIPKRGSFATTYVLSNNVADSFKSTILATANGNILYPLLNLFHRAIAFQYNWPLKQIFIDFYDRSIYLDIIYVTIIIFGVFLYKRILSTDQKKMYLFFTLTLIFSLFLFTLNVDILKNIFLLFGYIPGFVMFRNFYDKFAFGFVFFYSLFFSISLMVVNERFKSMRKYINLVVLILILINVIPIKQIVNKPLWKTKDIYTVITIPNEYTNFMNEMKNDVMTSSSVLTLPYNIAAYSFIKDTNTNNVYVGTSPVVLFTGLNDFSGDLSFAGTDSATFKQALLAKNYNGIQNIMDKYAINYIFVTNNIPQEVRNSYLFEPKVLAAQDKIFLSSISGKLVLSSSKGNYQLYTAKHMTPLISGKNVTFEKLSPVKFRVTIKNLKGNEALTYRDTYNGDWKLFPENTNSVKKCTVIANYSDYGTSECARGNSFTFGELQYLFIKSIPDIYHQPLNDFGNTWTVSESYIKKNFSKSTYTLNKDGSMNITFTLYFVPQTYFYIGTIVSVLTFAGLGCYVLFEYLNKRKK